MKHTYNCDSMTFVNTWVICLVLIGEESDIMTSWYDDIQFPIHMLSNLEANDGLWNLITYCAATGGSLLVIGSAAGVAFMGALAQCCVGIFVGS